METDFITSVLTGIIFMSVAVLASLALKRIHFPYTIGLMVIGIIAGLFIWNFKELETLRNLALSPDIILYLILPTLIFEASLNIDARMLFRNIGVIVLLAVFGLLISALVVAFGLAAFASLPIAGALLFGALISATDPVAVIALFKEVGAPKRLVTIIDGESLFNDATAIVLFTIIAGAVGMGSAHVVSPSVLGGAVQFVIVLVGGLVVGGVLGFLLSYLIEFDKGNFLFQITVSVIMAYLSFLIADHFFHFSGVMSSLAAGLVLRYRSEVAFKRHHIHTLEMGWEFFSFVANSFVFILLGLTELNAILHQGDILKSLFPVLISLPIVLVARFLSIVLLVPAWNLFLKRRKFPTVPWSYQLILFWGGLRGAVPVALVLAIPVTFPDRDMILHLTMGIILFTLLIQGTTVKKLMNVLGVKPDGSPFADRPTAKNQHVMSTPDLADLVLSQAQKGFEAEGFLADVQDQPGEGILVLRKGPQMVTIDKKEDTLFTECEPKDQNYLYTVLQEATLEIRRSMLAMDTLKSQSAPEANESNSPGRPGTYTLLLKHLKPANIILGIPPEPKEELIKILLNHLDKNGEIRKSTQAFTDVMERERSVSTGLGKGLAAPHAKTTGVNHMALALGICPEGTEFDALDGKPVKIIAMILSPKGGEGPHLQILSQFIGLLNRDSVRQALLAAQSPEEVYQILRHPPT